MSAACLEQEYSYMYVTAKPLWFLRMMVVAKAYWKWTMGLTLFGGEGGKTNFHKKFQNFIRGDPYKLGQTPPDQQNISKANIILEGSRHPNFMYPFEYGKSFHNKSFQDI